jgi:hypothetical protein
MSVEAAAHDRVKYLLTIKRNERSPSSETAAHHHRNAQESGRDPDIVKTTPLPSRPREFHPEPLTDPDLILSHHPARAID